MKKTQIDTIIPILCAICGQKALWLNLFLLEVLSVFVSWWQEFHKNPTKFPKNPHFSASAYSVSIARITRL